VVGTLLKNDVATVDIQATLCEQHTNSVLSLELFVHFLFQLLPHLCYHIELLSYLKTIYFVSEPKIQIQPVSELYYIGPYFINSGHAVAKLFEALCYQPEDRGFDFRWCHWNFSLT
jgi:hypothetical protein